VFGCVVIAVVAVAIAAADPRPGLSGDGPWVALALALFLAGLPWIITQRDHPLGRQIAGLTAIAASSWVLSVVQPDGPALAGTYIAVIMAALRLPSTPALIVAGGAVVVEVIVLAFVADRSTAVELGFLTSAIPWFLVMRLVRDLRLRHVRAEELVEELRESRAAAAESATLAERGRLARDMHDVLAHSLSALAIQLEAARLLARDRGGDPDVVATIERAHHHATSGLEEARRAIAALRGDELPGPERLQDLADAFTAASEVTCAVAATGVPCPLSADARLTIYRTAQEALTNVRRHSAADRVELRLEYEPEGVALVVQDHGRGAPVAVGAGSGGYGLTGMRERAELLGGRLRAEPTADGFVVELWLPA
jgi:signal transduction histidine kinase